MIITQVLKQLAGFSVNGKFLKSSEYKLFAIGYGLREICQNKGFP